MTQGSEREISTRFPLERWFRIGYAPGGESEKNVLVVPNVADREERLEETAAVHHPYATLMKSIGCYFNGKSTGISHKIPLI